MSIYVCDQCNTVENTALALYWTKPPGAPALCSQCEPEIGSWHGAFARETYDPARHKVINRGQPANARDEFFGDQSPGPGGQGLVGEPAPAPPKPKTKPAAKPKAQPKTRR